MHHALMIGSRVIVGLIGAFAFYLTFCLYEGEDGLWQDRIDDLWRSVYKRAQTTESVTVALFNKLGEILIRAFTRVFGEKLLSFRSFAVSINLSLAGGWVFVALVFVSLSKQPSPHGTSLCIQAALLFFAAAVPALFSQSPWLTILSLIPITSILVGAIVMFPHLIIHPGYQAQPLILLLSFLSDYVAIIILRKRFVAISTERSTPLLVLSIMALVAFAFLVFVFPQIGLSRLGEHLTEERGYRLILLGMELSFFNFLTAFLCLAPALAVIFLLLHKLAWPFLSRALSPFSRFKIVTNRKVLAAFGGLCSIFAFNLEHVGIKELVKILS